MEGRSLSDGMSKQPVIFSDLYINMVRAGESSGALVEVLRRMALHFPAVCRGAGQDGERDDLFRFMVCCVGMSLILFSSTSCFPTSWRCSAGSALNYPCRRAFSSR